MINVAESLVIQRLGLSVRGIANWILDFADREGAEVTNMALNKLVFFAVEAILLKKGALVTNARIEAWDHGPVFREIYHDFKSYGDKPITTRAKVYSPLSGKLESPVCEIDDDLEKTLECEMSALVGLTASQLRRLSHVKEGAWHQVWSYEGHANPGMEIKPEMILAAYGRRGD